MSDVKGCAKCGKPVRLKFGEVDVFDDACSNECAIALWNADQEAGHVVAIGITPTSLDEKLSTTGISLDDEELLA